MSYKKYPKYKPSGVEWIGNIPQEWEVVPSRCVIDHIVKKNFDNEETRYLSLMANIGVILYEDKGDIGNKKPDDLTKCKIVKKGNLVINSMNYAIGSYGISNYDGVCSPVYIVLNIKDNINKKYAFRLFELQSFQKYIQSFGNGILSHRCAIGWDELKGQLLPLPPLHEQEKIALVLDEKCEKIDTAISQKEKLNALLKEQKLALINQAVTKGIDKNVSFIDSDIEWIGQIPKHWEIKKLRYLGALQNGISKGAEYFGMGYPFMSYGDVYNNEIIPLELYGKANSTQEDRKFCSIKKGDIFFTRTSENVNDIGISSVCLQTIPNAVFSGFLIRLRQYKQTLKVEYAKYLFRSGYLQHFFKKELTMVTRASLSQELLKKLPVIIPPFEEQKQIADYLDEKCEKIDKAIKLNVKYIQKLKEYKTSLIDAIVAGKVIAD